MMPFSQRFILTHTNADPLRVAEYFSADENDCWDFILELERTLRDAERTRRENLPDTLSLVEELDPDGEIRRTTLLQKLYHEKYHPGTYDIKKLASQVMTTTNEHDAITKHDIDRAKAYPIHDLLQTEHRKGNISCPFHQDRNPSFHIKKNNAYRCYSCGEFGDSIDLYMKLNNVDFISAVKALQ